MSLCGGGILAVPAPYLKENRPLNLSRGLPKCLSLHKVLVLKQGPEALLKSPPRTLLASYEKSIKKSVSESNFDVLFWPNGNLTHLVEPSISSCKHSKTKKHGDALHNRHLALVSTPRARRSTLQRAIFCSRSHTYPTLRCLRPQEVLTCAPEGLCWQRSGC